MQDFDYERLAERVGSWASNFIISVTDNTRDSSGNLTISTGTTTGGNDTTTYPIQEDPFVGRVRFDRFDTMDVNQMKITVLEEKIKELEQKLAEVAALLDEHIKRTNPLPDRKAKRSIIVEEE